MFFSIAATKFHVTTNSVQGFQFFSILTNLLCFLFVLIFFFTITILTYVRWSHLILICISLIINDVEHLFICLLVVVCLEEIPINQAPCSFFNGYLLFLFVQLIFRFLFLCLCVYFFAVEFRITLYILYIKILLDI